MTQPQLAFIERTKQKWVVGHCATKFLARNHIWCVPVARGPPGRGDHGTRARMFRSEGGGWGEHCIPKMGTERRGQVFGESALASL